MLGETRGRRTRSCTTHRVTQADFLKSETNTIPGPFLAKPLAMPEVTVLGVPRPSVHTSLHLQRRSDEAFPARSPPSAQTLPRQPLHRLLTRLALKQIPVNAFVLPLSGSGG